MKKMHLLASERCTTLRHSRNSSAVHRAQDSHHVLGIFLNYLRWQTDNVIALITLTLALFTLRTIATVTIDFHPRQCLTYA